MHFIVMALELVSKHLTKIVRARSGSALYFGEQCKLLTTFLESSIAGYVYHGSLNALNLQS